MPAAPEFPAAEIVKHLQEQREGCHVRKDGVKVFKVLVQPTQNVQHENMIGDVDTEVGEGVGKAIHLPTVVVDAEFPLNETPECGIDVEGVGFAVAEEVVLQCQPDIMSHVATLPGDVLQVRGDGGPDP
jgi:hypothetical protein